MILRLRSRDGLERVEVADNVTLGDLRQTIHEKLLIPLGDMRLSKNPGLLTTKNPQAPEFSDLIREGAPLKSLGLQHGDMLFMLYSGERVVEPVYKKSVFESRKFGASITVEDIAAMQTRIERQEKAVVDSISFDRYAANNFQAYVNGTIHFNIKRGGLLYGTVDENNNVRVEFIYEPPQEGSTMTLNLQRNTKEEAQVDLLAEMLGCKKVGWIFNQSTAERDFIMHTEELMQVAAMQAELGETCTTVVVSFDAEENQVHFEAFQCSKQCVQLVKDGWLCPTPDGETPKGVTRMQNPKEPDLKEAVMVAGKDASEVDNDYFLTAVKILDHAGPLSSNFPIENRLIPQTKEDLRQALRRGGSSVTYVERISDFHLLLWLSKQPNLDANDMVLLCDAVKEKKPVMEGYRAIIDAIAGL